MSKTYKINVYTNNGDFIADVSDIASMSPFTMEMNGGVGTLNIPMARAFQDIEEYLELGNEYRIFEIDEDGIERRLYSGFVRGISRTLSNSGPEVVVNLVGYVGRLNRTLLSDTGNVFAFNRDGTYSSDPGSFDSEKSSDQVKFITSAFRLAHADIDQELETGTNGINFGSTTRITQAFTTGTDTEKLDLVGVQLYMKWNGLGTRDRIDVSIRADDGTGKPTGGNLGLARIDDLPKTSEDWIWVLFDTPITLTASTKYHIYVVSAGSSATNVYKWQGDTGGNNLYTGGDAAVSTNSGSTWTVQTNDDLRFRTMYVDESKVRIKFDEENQSIDDSGDDKNFIYNGMSSYAGLEYVTKISPTDWYWFLDADNTMQFHPIGFTNALVLDTCDDSSGWSVLFNTTNVVGSRDRKEGSRSVSFDLDGTGNSHLISNDISSTDLSPYSHAGFWIKVPEDPGSLDFVAVRLYSDSQTNWSEWRTYRDSLNFGEWNWITPGTLISSTPDDSFGTFDNTAVDRITCRVRTIDSADTTSWNIDDFKAGNIALKQLTIGRDVVDLSYNKNLDDIMNSFVITDSATSSPIIRWFENPPSQETYGKWMGARIDGRLSDSDTISAIGESTLAKFSQPNTFVECTVSPQIPLDDVLPGKLVKFSGVDSTLDIIYNYYVIIRVNWTIRGMKLTCAEIGSPVGEKISEVERRLENLESYSGSTGDFPTSQAT